METGRNAARAAIVCTIAGVVLASAPLASGVDDGPVVRAVRTVFAASPATQVPEFAPVTSAAPRPRTAGSRPGTRAARTDATGEPLRAVLVGVNHVAGSPTLEGAVNDARTLRDALVRYGFPSGQIALLTEGQVTHDAVLAAARRLALAPADAPVVFSYAGHGRKNGGVGGLAMSDGRSVTATELAAVLGRVRAPLWSVFTQCYAGSFAVPGIVGARRIATFATGADGIAWESLGMSLLGRWMVEDAMLKGRAPASVEQAFGYAAAKAADEAPNALPIIDDGFAGELALGPAVASPAPTPSLAPVPAAEAPTLTPAATPPACTGLLGLGCS